MATYTRGVLTTVSGSLGYIQSFDGSNSSTEDTIEDHLGVTKSVEFINEVNECDVTVKFDRDASLPGNGTTVTIAAAPAKYNGLYYVMNDKFKEQNKTSCEVTLSLKRYVDGQLPAA